MSLNKSQIEEIRKDFLYLDGEKVGKDVIYLDTTATSQKPIQVIDRVAKYYKYENANPHRGAHYLGWKATEEYESGRDRIQKFLGANRREEVVFTKNATESMNILAHSYALEKLKEGDEILITILEHHANIVPWQRVAKQTGAKLVYAYLNEDYSLNYDDLYSKINENTRIVSITGASNVTSEIIDVKNVIDKSHEVGAKAFIDAAQLAPHMKVNVVDLDCDAYSFSGHKMLAPLGIGILYAKYELLDEMSPFNLGGDMIEYVYEDYSTFEKPPIKFEAGTQNVGGVIGLAAAIDYIDNIGMDNIFSYEHELTNYAYELIKDIPNLKIFHPVDRPTGSTLSFTFTDIHPHDVATILDQAGVGVRSGHHCAMPLHTYLDINATARASFAVYNTKEEAEIFARELANVRKVMGL